MFWRKKSEIENRGSRLPLAEQPKLNADPLAERAKNLAVALNEYSRAAYEALDVEDRELQEAYIKVNNAEKLVRESRLGFALGRCIPEHVKHWPSWITRDDFPKWVGFNGQNITAEKVERGSEYGLEKVSKISFEFNSTSYQLLLIDEGISRAPGDTYRFGKIQLIADNVKVANFGLMEDFSDEYSTWEFANVNALKVGNWMQDMLDIAAQIQKSDEHRRKAFTDNRIRAAAKEIDLE